MRVFPLAVPLLLLVLLLALAAPASAAAQRPDELPQLGGAVDEEVCPRPAGPARRRRRRTDRARDDPPRCSGRLHHARGGR